MRGGAFKPRSSPYSFQGMGEEGLKLMNQAGAKYNLPIVTEVMSISQIDIVGKYADILPNRCEKYGRISNYSKNLGSVRQANFA